MEQFLSVRTLILAILVLLYSPLFSQTTIDSEDFENGWGIWNDGGSDCRLFNNTLPNGNAAVRLRDGNGTNSSMTTDAIDLSSFNLVTFAFEYQSKSMENGDDFWVQFSNDGGNSWTTIATYVIDQDFFNDTTYTPSINIDNATYNFSINSNFRIRCDASWSNDELYIDNISIVGSTENCITSINTFPYTEGFENNDIGQWTQNGTDDIDWTVHSGGTPSNNTGPNGANQGNYYIYTESSNNITPAGSPNKTAMLDSPCFDLTSETTATFEFYYHMFGGDMGTMDVLISTDNGANYTTIWSQQGEVQTSENDSWTHVSINLDSYVGNTVKLRILGQTGNDWQSDMAVDDILLDTSGNSGSGNCDVTINTFPYTEGFENNDVGQWAQNQTDDIDWTVHSGGTPSGNTGPSGANQGTYYMYTEASYGNDNKDAILDSPCFDLTNVNAATFEFNYHMYGQDMGTLDVLISTDNGANYTSLWTQSGEVQNNHSDSWTHVSINLDSYVGSTVKLRILGHTGNGYRSDMAVDDMALNVTSAQPEISITGNGTEILDGDTTPSVADNTDFGTLEVGTTQSYTFTIENTGSADLALSGTPMVSMNGDAAFSITSQPANTTVGAGNSTTFTVQFNPTDDGTFTANITLANNDADEANYTFSVQGQATITLTQGPGGVTNDLQLWLKADNGSSYNDGDSVTLWTDQGRGADATTNLSSQAPTYRNNANKNINFNPVIEFDNDFVNPTQDTNFAYDNTNSQFLQGTSGFYTQDIFVVLQQDDTDVNDAFGGMTILSGDADSTTNALDETGIGLGDYTGRVSGESVCFALDASANNTYAVYDGPSASYSKLGIINARNNAAQTQQELYLNGENIGTNQNNVASFININNSKYWIGRSEGWNASLNARVAEVITFSQRKSDGTATDERNKILSYLAIKYGITLGNNGTVQDYVDAAGNVLWDATANANYSYDIAGIGRDDSSGLNQKQSKSTNEISDATGLTNGFLSIGLSDIYATNQDNIANNTTTFSNQSFLVWGHNNANITDAPFTINVDMSAGISGLSTPVEFNGMQRIWKVVETGADVPTVKVSIPENVIRNMTAPGDYLMFVSDTETFGASTEYVIMTSDGQGNIETNYDFNGTKYITFGYTPELVVERSINFDGVEDYIEVGDYKDLNAAFTISAWVKNENNGTKASIVSKRDAAYTEGYDFEIQNNNKIAMSWNGGADAITSNTKIPNGEWHHIAVIFNNGTATLYIDGVLDQTAFNLNTPNDTAQSFIIAAAGASNTTDFFKGNLDEIRIWNVALTESQLRYMMNQEIADDAGSVNGTELPNTIASNDASSLQWSDLAGYYPMSVFTYTNISDLSYNKNNGKVRKINTVDYQTAPLPYQTANDGNWNDATTWYDGSEQIIPGSISIANPNISVDWNIVKVNNNVVMDNSVTLASHNATRDVLGLFIDSTKELTIAADGALNVSHYFELNGKIDLEGESQLLQPLNSVLSVGINGLLERDQQGTADKYTYNYWGSPVGATATIETNETFAADYSVADVLRDGTDPLNPQNINFITSGYNGTNTTPIGIADYWIWKFGNQTSGSYSSWQHARSTGTIKAGEGFTMKGPGTGGIHDEQNYVFEGKPNNGTITLAIGANSDYLVGNPYPSAIDANEFLFDNQDTNGTIYLWEHWGGGSHNISDYQGGYATYNFSGGVPAASFNNNNVGTGPTKMPKRFIPVGQGFFISSTNGGTIKFENDQRVFNKEVGNSSTFFRTTSDTANPTTDYTVDDRMKFRIGLNSVNQIHRQLLLTVDTNATENVDWGYDGALNEAQMDDMYWLIEGNKYGIQGVGAVTDQTIIPIGVSISTAGMNTITIDDLENVPDDLDIYIHDEELNIYHNIRESDYQVYLESGDYLSRFSMVFQPGDNTLGTQEIEQSSIVVYFNATNGKIIVQNPNSLAIDQLELFNILGQSVLFDDAIKTQLYSEVETPTLSAGTYIVNLKTKGQTISKKLIIR